MLDFYGEDGITPEEKISDNQGPYLFRVFPLFHGKDEVDLPFLECIQQSDLSQG